MAAASIHRNEKVAMTLLFIVLGMTGLAFASVPLYSLFCQVTGYGGTTQVSSGPKGIIDREMTVRFDSNVDRGLAWSVKPARAVTDRIGASETVSYTATNLTNRPITGMALFNVTPENAGYYFNKMECFCFTEQTLQPGETVEMPVTFFVDPELDQNHDLDTVHEITLSYSFFASDQEGS
ncbi:cytochrome c oxidase assembly protein CtaG [Devosia pacifica]|uniref:Cytochrome c oxidase assembly protein CtaG n=1 Tax=Devosia pacifica TaxID=1335967 RepID=A0A918SBD2_9HYPH|nr:cytochrome c oxidase assembly protein [Devosia pacifica]GHA30586.1 cytochrome c oxidase assembly protein CtaG [Devosia pacifica]